MALDLARLRDMHPLLSLSTAQEYAHRAAVGLARHDHRPGVQLGVVSDGVRSTETLQWQAADKTGGEHLDALRITEDAAEAIALALAYVIRGWTVRRRLQRGEAADWLLMDANRRLVAMEVSGVNTVDRAERRLRAKMEQVRQCRAAGTRVACVAELGPPAARLRTA